VLRTSLRSPQAGAVEPGRSTTENAESTEPMMDTDPFTGRAIGGAIEVHRVPGPGLLESTYSALNGWQTASKRFKF